MSTDFYIVVFEYNETMGGLFGVRFFTPFPNRTAFETASVGLVGQSVIAADVTKEHAEELVHLTPEICRLMGAVETVYREYPNPNTNQVMSEISMAKIAIEYDREYLKHHHRTRPDARKYLDAFRKLVLVKEGPLTLKTATFAAILIQNRNRFGELRK